MLRIVQDTQRGKRKASRVKKATEREKIVTQYEKNENDRNCRKAEDKGEKTWYFKLNPS